MCMQEQERAGEPGLERMWNKRRLDCRGIWDKGKPLQEHVYITTGMAHRKGARWLRRGKQEEYSWSRQEVWESLPSPAPHSEKQNASSLPSRAHRTPPEGRRYTHFPKCLILLEQRIGRPLTKAGGAHGNKPSPPIHSPQALSGLE